MYRSVKQKMHRLFFPAKTVAAIVVIASVFAVGLINAPSAYADLPSSPTSHPNPNPSNASGSTLKTGGLSRTKYQCGSGASAVYTSIDIGCKGKNCHTSNPSGCSALTDMVFAIIRALSVGVGLVIVASMIFAGIQYTASRDDPSAVGKAKERVLNNVIALLVYIFAYAILNYVIPRGFFQ